MSTVFKWDKKDIDALLATCETDGLLPYIEKYFPEKSKVLESGCGLARYVRYMQDRGWDMVGLEIDPGAVKAVKKIWPDLKVIEGDAADSPFKNDSFDGIISLGVIEHWTEGPQPPLKDMYRTLKPGGVALITTPCLSTVRKIKAKLWWDERRDSDSWDSWRSKGEPKPNRLKKNYKFFTNPSYGDFFEYRFTKKQFNDEVRRAGFEIIEHKPSAVIDGLYHELNPKKRLIKFENWQFKPTLVGKIANSSLSLIPYFHPHMQIIIAKKPIKQRSSVRKN